MREVYEVDSDTLLLVASDRVSAFDVVLKEPVPHKGAVLTQLSAFWFRKLAAVMPSHFLTADADEIAERVPALATEREPLAGRAMLVRRTTPVPFECVVRGYIAGSAWAEYGERGTLAGEPLPEGLVESARLDPPIFSPATKAETGHDENVSFSHVAAALGLALAERLKRASLALYEAGRGYARPNGIASCTRRAITASRTSSPAATLVASTRIPSVARKASGRTMRRLALSSSVRSSH